MTTKRDARKLDLFGKEDLRRRTARAVIQEGLNKAEATRVFGVSRTSVHAWLDLYESHGEAGLTPKRPRRARGGGRLKGWQAACAMDAHHLGYDGGLECAACHAAWTPNCVGCHFTWDERLTGLNLVTRQYEVGKASTDNKTFESFKHYFMGPNAQGRISPYISAARRLPT